MTYKLEKSIWTEADFEQMGWHDSYIYKIRVAEDLELDIDYIFQWIKPEVEGLPFTFWVAPCTLIFRQIKHLTFELKTAFDDAIEIEDIERTENEDHILWTILTRQGEIEFISEGFKQYVRQEPFYQFGQTIHYIERYGFSLDRTTTQENPNRNREDILQQRKNDLELYEIVKKRQLKRIEKEQLNKLRENKEIDLKEFLIKKKEIDVLIFHYDYRLKDSGFEDLGKN